MNIIPNSTSLLFPNITLVRNNYLKIVINCSSISLIDYSSIQQYFENFSCFLLCDASKLLSMILKTS